MLLRKLKVIGQNCGVLKYAAESLRADKDIVLAVVKNCRVRKYAF